MPAPWCVKRRTVIALKTEAARGFTAGLWVRANEDFQATLERSQKQDALSDSLA